MPADDRALFVEVFVGEDHVRDIVVSGTDDRERAAALACDHVASHIGYELVEEMPDPDVEIDAADVAYTDGQMLAGVAAAAKEWQQRWEARGSGEPVDRRVATIVVLDDEEIRLLRHLIALHPGSTAAGPLLAQLEQGVVELDAIAEEPVR